MAFHANFDILKYFSYSPALIPVNFSKIFLWGIYGILGDNSNKDRQCTLSEVMRLH